MNLSLPKFSQEPEKVATKAKKKKTANKSDVKTTQEGPLLSLGQVFEQMLAISMLALLVVGSSLAVIYASYDYRRLFNQHQMLVRETDNYRIEWGQLLIEQSTWGSNSRVEKVATESMDMRAPSSKEIRLVRHE